MTLGRIEPNQAPNRIGHGKAIKPMFLSILEAIIIAALSASMKKGIGQVFLSVIRERTNPGAIMFTCIFSFASLGRSASPYALTHALLALYEGQPASP